jgi:hypothetical protein
VYLTIREYLHNCLRQELSLHPAELYVTGHSMAGALAAIAAVDLSLHSIPQINAYIAARRRKEKIRYGNELGGEVS